MGIIKDYVKKKNIKTPKRVKQPGVSNYLKNKKRTTEQLNTAFDYRKKLTEPESQTMQSYKKTQQRRKHQ